MGSKREAKRRALVKLLDRLPPKRSEPAKADHRAL